MKKVKEQSETIGCIYSYWLAVENMKLSGKRHWHQMAAQIYQMYLTSAGSVVRTALDKGTVKNMEAFMLGNKVLFRYP